MEEDKDINEFIKSLNPDMLYVDTREPSSVFNYLEKKGVEFRAVPLPIGDFYKAGVVIERKTIMDFVGSIRSGHLKKQMIQMNNNFKKSFLIISGSLKQLQFTPIKSWTVNHHMGALAHTLCRYPNVKVMVVDNDSQLINLAFRIIDKSLDNKEVEIIDTEIMMLRPSEADTQTKMFTCIPSISFGRAKKLSKRLKFKLVYENGAEVTERNLLAIPGIGKGLAKQLIKINAPK